MKKTKKISNIVKNLSVLILSIAIFISGFVILWVSTFKIPDLSSFNERVVVESTKIYDKTGKIVLYDVHQNIKRTTIPYEKIGDNAKNAVISIEDNDFYNHGGIKISSILRAVFANLVSGDYSQGGSTITQQVVKNSLLTSDKTITRKLKEWGLSIKLEQVMDKKSILTLYFNEAPYGGNIYGVEEASLAFFGKHAEEMTLAESAYIAAIPKAPTYYSPYGKNKDKLIERKNMVLAKMLEYKYITEEQYKKTLDEKVDFLPRADTGIKAPHFVMYIKDYLEQKYGKDAIESEGFKVITTLDYNLQQKAEEIVKRNALENKKKFNAENAGVVAIEAKTGQILIMVGSRDYFDEEIDGNFNITTAHRQPGSSFKPFVYATAFSKGYTPETVVFDVPTEFSQYCDYDGNPIKKENADKCYSPQNYDDIFRGPMTLKEALAQSINVPAVKILYLTGVKESIETARNMGIKSLTNANQYGLTLVLGGGEVSPLDMASAYSVFANEGIKNPTTGILQIEDKNGKIIEKYEEHPQQVLQKQVALQISNILSDNVARTPAYGSNSALYFGKKDVAVKTGTTNDYRDTWTVGYTKDVALAAWAGNNDNSPIEKRVAGLVIAPVWHEIMQEIINKYPDTKFEKPQVKENNFSLKPVLRGFWQGNESFIIDKISGGLATEYTPEETKKEVIIQNVHSILYWIDKDNPQGEKPSNPGNDSQFGRWEYGVIKWLSNNGVAQSKPSTTPSYYDSVHTAQLVPQIEILNPKSDVQYNSAEKMNIVIKNKNNQYPISKASYYINGKFIGSSQNSLTFSFIPNEIEEIKQHNELKVIVYDYFQNKAEVMEFFELSLN